VSRPPVFRARMLGVVVAGGMIGVALRELLLLPFTADAGPFVVPAATLGVNVVGSFLLGVVIARLGDRHPLSRAFLGTGVLGGFTTYSAFAVHTAGLLTTAPMIGIAFGAGCVLLGLGAAALGLRLAEPPRVHQKAAS
jgi:fluoride exporter